MSESPIPIDSLKIELPTVAEAVVSNDAITVRINEIAALRQGTWEFTTLSGTDLSLFFLNFSGLMVGTRHIEPQASTGSSVSNVNLDGFKFLEDADSTTGIFLVDETLDEFVITNWPEELGAPTKDDGSHKLYGDKMAWAAYSAESPGSRGKGGVQDIRIGMSVYVFDDSKYEDAIFVRYDITNVGSEIIPEVFTGFYSDVDLIATDGRREDCRLDYSDINQSGYDLDRGLLYAYNRPEIVDGELSADCYGFTAGMAFLDLSKGNASDGLYSNRIVTKFSGGDYFPRFSEPLIQDPTTVIRALQGLDADGSPMTNPVSGQTTLFSFTGDPVQESGWLDERRDIRQLLSKPAFALDSGETKSLALVWIVANGSDFGDAISKLKDKYDAIVAAPELWDY